MKTIGFEQIAAMLTLAAGRIKENHAYLSQLDAATGDGDHGTTMVRVADALLASIKDCPAREPAALLDTVGWGVLSVDGGSTGPLLGSLFLGMSEAIPAGKAELNCTELAGAFDAGLAKLAAQTPAKVGDKTMVDALVPAVQAIRAAADRGDDVSAALAGGAQAALQGSDGTKDLQAKFGRARNLGARTIGTIDPGSRSIAILFAAFRDAVNE